jgi:GNAT superfamily N-acetyltransferase
MNNIGIAIREYLPSDQPWFERLNREWIEQYFHLEPVDIQVLREPGRYILKSGGRILMALYNGEIAGTVALKFASSGVYEFTKMAVDERFRGKKIGLALSEAALRCARNMGAHKIILYSSTKLKPALSLYRKIGFAEVPVDGPYKRSDVKMELYLSAPVQQLEWFQRKFHFGAPAGMLPFFLERLAGTLPRLQAKVKNVPDEILSEKANDKWSVKQNIGHLAEVDEISRIRISEMIGNVSPMSPAVFEPKNDYNAMTIADILSLFERNREANLFAFRNLSSSELGRSSIHPRLKVPMNPTDLAFFDAEHDDHHLVRINEILHRLKL